MTMSLVKALLEL